MKKLKELVMRNGHNPLKQQAKAINQVLRGHYAYYGLGGNQGALHRVYRHTEQFWRRALSKRCWKGGIDWERFQKIKDAHPLQRPKLHIPYMRMQQYVVL